MKTTHALIGYCILSEDSPADVLYLCSLRFLHACVNKLVVVWLEFLLEELHLLFLEASLDHGPHALDGVKLRCVRDIEDQREILSHTEVPHLDAVVYTAVVKENSNYPMLMAIEEVNKEVNEVF